MPGMSNSRHKNRILFLVTGLSPQIVTETLYALCISRQPAFIPTKVHLLTTAEGAKRARLMLFEEPQAHFLRFCEEYGLPELEQAFSPDDIEVVRGADGRPLKDIVTEEDNAAVADAIMQRVRALAAIENSAIHASVAGGRKTMGVALALAMSLFGRAQDALSHVLVSPPFESHPEFFYPPRTPRVLITGAPPQQKPVSTADAEVSLAEIPFLRLRPMLPQELLAGANSWQELIRRAQASISAPMLIIDLPAKSFFAGEKQLEISPANAAFLLMLAQRRKEGRPTYCPQEGAPEKELAQDFLAAMDRLGFSDERHARTRSALRHGMEKDFFERRKSAVNRAFREALGPGPAGAFIIGRHRDANGRHRHDLPLQPEQIIIREE
jgi:CRISPR-associated protein (TIGR02584 family)